MTTDDESDLETLYTTFVLSMVMVSVLATPAILAMGYTPPNRSQAIGRFPAFRRNDVRETSLG